MKAKRLQVRVGTKVEHIDPDQEVESDYGEVVDIKGDVAVVKWHASGLEGEISFAELVDLVVEDWDPEFWEPESAELTTRLP